MAAPLRAAASRRGLTLVELLAVIAIIGLLVGLLMPALQSARESSRRTTCTSNIKTLAMASLTHLEQIGTFPSDGWPNANTNTLVNANRGFNEDQGGGWLYNILPFMELESLRNQSNSFTLCHGSSPPVLGCPTTFSPGAVVIVDGWQRRGATCYAGSMGTIDRLPHQNVVLPDGTTGHTTLLDTFPRAQREATYPRFVNYPHLVAGVNSGAYNNGVIGSVGRVRAAHVTDGLSNTLLCAERAIHNNNVLVMTNNMPCDGAGGSWVVNYGWTNLKTTWSSPRPFIQGLPTGCERSFGSRHSDTFAVAFCDGSVRQVSFAVDAVNVWRPAGSRNGRESAPLPE
jgi:prepilin-type N-terminal cleavage/methylation domain-containing protein/prepilin-type processing-associated H-X9-DG protein